MRSVQFVAIFFVVFAITFAKIQNRIANGRDAQLKQFPYVARIDLVSEFPPHMFSYFVCGGSLISDRFILTAGTCLYSAQTATISLGSVDIRNNEPTRIQINVTSANFIVHELFKHGLYKNDIALIKLPNRIDFTDAVQPINLSEKAEPLEGVAGVFSGYGKIQVGYEGPSILRFGMQKVLSDKNCAYYYQEYYDNLHHFCIDSFNGTQACTGDVGGPFVIGKSDNNVVLVGITLYHTTICGGGHPVVYGKISSYLDWIKKHMN